MSELKPQAVFCKSCGRTLATGKVSEYRDYITYSLCKKKDCKNGNADVFVVAG